jgi:glycerol-3-phosphate acyltransferase PlsY
MIYYYYLFAGIIGYLFGSIPFGYLLIKTFFKQDIRTSGSGNIGATNVYRIDKNLGIITFALDATKALVAIFFISQFEIIFPNIEITHNVQKISYLITGFFTIIGHMYPLFLKFKGGKGVSSMIGYFLYIDIVMTLIGLIGWLLTFKYSRYSSLSSLVFVLISVIYGLIFVPDAGKFFILLVALLVIYQHQDNIKRLINNKENKMT